MAADFNSINGNIWFGNNGDGLQQTPLYRMSFRFGIVQFAHARLEKLEKYRPYNDITYVFRGTSIAAVCRQSQLCIAG